MAGMPGNQGRHVYALRQGLQYPRVYTLVLEGKPEVIHELVAWPHAVGIARCGTPLSLNSRLHGGNGGNTPGTQQRRQVQSVGLHEVLVAYRAFL